jgi:uncharacterized membrane protein YgdD (TMEM256/DUF423 family)
MNGRIWIIIGSLSAAIAVGVGAWGAHGLESFLTQRFPQNGAEDIIADAFQGAGYASFQRLPAEDLAKRLANWKTGTEYQLAHSLALILIGTLIGFAQRNRTLSIAATMLLLGIVLFSGMLYGWVLLDQKWMVHVVPVGGLSLIVGWVVLALGAVGLKANSPVD